MQLALTEERTLILQTARQFSDNELAAINWSNEFDPTGQGGRGSHQSRFDCQR